MFIVFSVFVIFYLIIFMYLLIFIIVNLQNIDFSCSFILQHYWSKIGTDKELEKQTVLQVIMSGSLGLLFL